jgi:hypothetical protein
MSIKVHLYDDRLACFVGADHVVTLTRKRRMKGLHQRCIDYRHVIGSVIQKPQAFRNYIYKEEMFPIFAFRQAWDNLNNELGERKACREYVGILKEAAEPGCESLVNEYLEACLEKDKLPNLEGVKKLFSSAILKTPEVESDCGDLSSYNKLLTQGGSK